MYMQRAETKNFLIRMPIELYNLLEKSAQEHHRSRTQEAIVALSNGLASTSNPLILNSTQYKFIRRARASLVV